jgi:hypothetical protein
VLKGYASWIPLGQERRMFVDFENRWSPPERREPEPCPRPNKRRETVAAWVIGFNLVMLVVGPLAGATLFDAVAALFKR